MKKYVQPVTRWKVEFQKVKLIEDLENDVVKQNIRHLPHC